VRFPRVPRGARGAAPGVGWAFTAARTCRPKPDCRDPGRALAARLVGLHRVPPRPMGSRPGPRGPTAVRRRRHRCRRPRPSWPSASRSERSLRPGLVPDARAPVPRPPPMRFVASSPPSTSRPASAPGELSPAIGAGVPPPARVPPSWFRTTSTVSSAETVAGLLHPAADPGVRRVSPRTASLAGGGPEVPRDARPPSKNSLVRRRERVTAPRCPLAVAHRSACAVANTNRPPPWREAPITALARGDLHFEPSTSRRDDARGEEHGLRRARLRGLSPRTNPDRRAALAGHETPCPSLGFLPLRGLPASAGTADARKHATDATSLPP